MKHIIKVTPELLDKVAKLADHLTPGIAETFGDGRKGGYIFICNNAGGQLLHKKLGEPDPAKKEKYRSFSREKAERLVINTEHSLSWESRQPDQNQYGGAVRLQNGLIISFSGFPELVDEAFCAAIATLMEWETTESLSQKLQISTNAELFAHVSEVANSLSLAI